MWNNSELLSKNKLPYTESWPKSEECSLNNDSSLRVDKIIYFLWYCEFILFEGINIKIRPLLTINISVEPDVGVVSTAP